MKCPHCGKWSSEPSGNKRRAGEMFVSHMEGLTFKNIGDAHGVSKERAREVVRGVYRGLRRNGAFNTRRSGQVLERNRRRMWCMRKGRTCAYIANTDGLTEAHVQRIAQHWPAFIERVRALVAVSGEAR